jgi:hypothetical protein
MSMLGDTEARARFYRPARPVTSTALAQVLLVERVFRCGGEYTEEAKQKFAEMFPESYVPHRNTVCQLIENLLKLDLFLTRWDPAGHK